MITRNEKDVMVNKIFSAQEVISEVVLELTKYDDTKELGYALSGLNSKIDSVRNKLKE